MSANLCLMAWNEPIVRPNCTRSFGIIYRRVEQRLGAAHHFIGERDGRLIESTQDSLCAIIEVAEQVGMSTVKIDARNLASRIHGVQKAPLHAAGIRTQSE